MADVRAHVSATAAEVTAAGAANPAGFPPPPPRVPIAPPIEELGATVSQSVAERFRGAVCANNFECVITLSRALDVCDAENAARALLSAVGEGQHLRLLKRLIVDQFEEHTGSPQDILRSQSLASRALGQHARQVGHPYLYSLLNDAVSELCDNPIEFDESADDEGGKSSAIGAWFERFVRTLTQPQALESLPAEMKELLHEMGRLGEKAHHPERLRVLVPSSYLILRFVNPALLTPEAHGIIETAPSDTARSSLKLMAKLVQNAANGSMPKESRLEPLKPFVAAAIPCMASFLLECTKRKPEAVLHAMDGGTSSGDIIANYQVEDPPRLAQLAPLARFFTRAASRLEAAAPAVALGADHADPVEPSSNAQVLAAADAVLKAHEQAITAAAARDQSATHILVRGGVVVNVEGERRSVRTRTASAVFTAAASAAMRALRLPTSEQPGTGTAQSPVASSRPPARRVLSFERLRRRSTVSQPAVRDPACAVTTVCEISAPTNVRHMTSDNAHRSGATCSPRLVPNGVDECADSPNLRRRRGSSFSLRRRGAADSSSSDGQSHLTMANRVAACHSSAMDAL